MKFNLIDNLRNIGISAHIDAGKTTTTERILFYTGINHKIGEVHYGSATMDWMDQEQERGITITSAATTVYWNSLRTFKKSSKINIIDTPGHVDFTIEVERSMRVIDGACMLYCAVGGVQSQSETVWKQSVKYNIPKIIFINKMDRLGCDFYKICEDLKNKLKANPVPIFIPYFLNNRFFGVIDLLNYKLILWNDLNNGMFMYYFDIPLNYLNISNMWRNNLINISIKNEKLINDFLKKNLSNNSILNFLRKKTINNIIQPVSCGSAFKNKGIQCLLDCIVNFLPSPLDLSDIKGYTIHGEKVDVDPLDDRFTALAFKIVNDPFIGQLVFFRVYSGCVNNGDSILNSSKNKKERIGRLLKIHANNKEDVKFICSGDIGALTGLKHVQTGDTLCSLDNFIILEKIFFPVPVISQSLNIKNKSDEEKILFSLNRLSHEDPSFKFHIDDISKQIIISGMGELHLEVLIEKIKRENNLDLFVGKPKVSYKETIKKISRGVEGKYIRQSGGRGQYGHVIIDIEPAERGSGFKFINNIRSGAIPKEYISSINKSFEESLNYGTLLGYPVTDLTIYLVDGSYHDVDSSENAFKIASSIAFKEAMVLSNPVLLEPIMIVSVEVPEDFFGLVLSDLSSKRGLFLQAENVNNDYKVIKCNIPLAEMFNYSTTLRSLTKGRGVYNMSFDFYSEVPPHILKNIF